MTRGGSSAASEPEGAAAVSGHAKYARTSRCTYKGARSAPSRTMVDESGRAKRPRKRIGAESIGRAKRARENLDARS